MTRLRMAAAAGAAALCIVLAGGWWLAYTATPARPPVPNPAPSAVPFYGG